MHRRRVKAFLFISVTKYSVFKIYFFRSARQLLPGYWHLCGSWISIFTNDCSDNPAKISTDDIQKKIAAVWVDTEKYSADDEVYNELPGCCLYERKKENRRD